MLKGAKLRLRITTFCKRISCPPSETLLAYRSDRIPEAARKRVFLHLAECEFCGAELQLLKRCPPDIEERQACEIPPHLRMLYEEVINGGRGPEPRSA